MKKFDMLFEIAKDCIADSEKARDFAFRCKEHKSVAEVENLYAEWKAGTKTKRYFEIEIIGYTPAKKNRLMKK